MGFILRNAELIELGHDPDISTEQQNPPGIGVYDHMERGCQWKYSLLLVVTWVHENISGPGWQSGW